jgi:riboflavin biosynthesis pyrimidine reductase
VRQIFDGERDLADSGSGSTGSDLTDSGLAALYDHPKLTSSGRWLRANMVASLDGAATLAGRSGGLSGEADRQVFAMLRALADVIVVGAGTARAEGYQPVKPGVEGVRWQWLREGRTPSPPIAIVTRRLDLDLSSPLLTSAPSHARTIIITTEAAPAERREAAAAYADVIVGGDVRVNLAAALDSLAERGHQRILTEGGPHLLTQLTGAGLLDELDLTFSPVLAGPAAGRIVQQAADPPGGGEPGGYRPHQLTLAHVLTDEGHLLCRYLRQAPGTARS